MKKEIKIDQNWLDFLKTAEKTKLNIFLTWYAGTWKSTLLDYFKSKTKKKFITLWTTWVAAKNVNWYTIHSFLGIMKDGKIKWMKLEKKEYIKNSDWFIIDEVSMLRADLCDLVDYVLRKITWCNELFWWKQIIFVWDLLQLLPVLVQHELSEWEKVETEEYQKFIERYSWRFFFNSNSYDKDKFKIVNLTKVHRQDNQELVNALNLIRSWLKNKDILDLLNSRVTKKENLCKKAIYIWSTNRIVDTINREKIESLKTEKITLKAIIQWDYPVEDYPADEWINLKVWCRIMFTNNHKDWLYSNWTLWTLIWKDWNKLIIDSDDWYEVELEKFTSVNVIWQDEIWEDIIWWTFTQFPIKIGHAITIHKSQGKTFDNVIIDTWYSWCFEAWMLYVAISRCTNLEWMQLVRKIKPSDIFADESVKKYLSN